MPDKIFTQTVRYNLSTVHNPADIATLTATTIGTASIVIAENGVSTPVKFKCADVYIYGQDTCTATGVSLQGTGNTFASASMGASSLSRIFRLPTTFTHSGENWSYLFGPLNARSIFATNFGTAQSNPFRVVWKHDGITGTGTAMRSVYSWVDVTYEYSSSAASRTQTICIPLGGRFGSLPTALQTQFTIPQLSGSGGLLDGYGSLNIRNAYLEINGNNAANGGGAMVGVTASFDGGAAINFNKRIMTLATNILDKYIYPYTQTTNASHTFQLACGTATRYHYINAKLWVTFTYVVATTTRIINNMRLPVASIPQPGLATDGRNLETTFNIQEPGPITTQYIAAELYATSLTSPVLGLRWGGASANTTFTFVGNLNAGQFPLIHTRSSALPGLTRGVNTLKMRTHATLDTVYNLTGMMHVLYSSAIPSGSVDVSNKTVMSSLGPFEGSVASVKRFSGSIHVSEPSYEIQNHGFYSHVWNSAAVNGYAISAEATSTESSGSYYTISNIHTEQDNENHSEEYFIPTITDKFKKFPEQISTDRILNVPTYRRYYYVSMISARPGLAAMTSYHCITSSVAGTLSNSNGGTITASLHRYDTGEVLCKVNRTGDGIVKLPAYDDTIKYYISVYENNTYKGRSKSDFPGLMFNVIMTGSASPGGASEHSYTFFG